MFIPTRCCRCGEIKFIIIFILDASSVDCTHWVMWFKKGKDKFYFDSCEVQPPSELIAYLKSLIFYNNQQNGEVFCSHIRSSH